MRTQTTQCGRRGGEARHGKQGEDEVWLAVSTHAHKGILGHVLCRGSSGYSWILSTSPESKLSSLAIEHEPGDWRS